MIDFSKNVVIRTGRVSDAEAILTIQRDVIKEKKYLVTSIEDFDITITEQKEWLKKILENKRKTIIVAEVNSEIAGCIVFQSPARKRLEHTGSFSVMIRKSHRGNGIGKLLVRKLEDWARKNPFIEKISLGVLSTNHHAISLYKSVGYVEEGRKVKEIKISEHEYADDILMYKFV